MPVLTIEVESRITGSTERVPELGSIRLTLTAERITVGELIERTVREQVHSLVERRKLAVEEAQQALDRQYLTPKELYEQAERGAVRFPSRRSRVLRQIDPDEAVRKAKRGFEEGSYIIIANGRQVHDLDEELTLSPESAVTFLRLVPLVGG